MLKKLLLLVFLVVSGTASAQSFYFEGFRGGLNVSTITHSDLGYRPGFYGSALATLRFKDFYAMQFETGYSNQGASGTKTAYILSKPRTGESEVLRTNTYHDPSLHYLTFGVMNKFTPFPKFNGYIGGSVEFLMTDLEKYTNDADFVWNIGFTYDVTDKLAVELRVKKGMFDVVSDSFDYRYDKNENGHTVEPAINTNLVFQVGLIYKLHFTYTDVKNLIKK